MNIKRDRDNIKLHKKKIITIYVREIQKLMKKATA